MCYRKADLPVALGIFGKKRGKREKNNKKASNDVVKKGRAPKKTKHQKKAPLSYTALEPFVDSLYGDNGFTADYEGENTGVVLILPFDEIGGLSTSKEDKRNQSKGTFVTSINKGDFEVYYDEKQDEEEQLVILANTDLVDTLADFSVVKDAEFRWGFFTRDGELIETDYVSTMDELIENRIDLEGYFESVFDDDTDNANTESTVIEDTSSDLDDLSELEGLNDLEELASEEPITSLNEEMSTVLETGDGGEVSQYDAPIINDTFDVSEEEPIQDFSFDNEIQEPNFGDADFQEDVQFDDQMEFGDEQYGDVYSDDSYDEDLMSDMETVDEEKVDELVDQVLFQNDLDLVLPIDRFRETYLLGSADFLIPYYEDDGTWLTKEANRLIHEANDDIHRRVLSDGDIAHSTYVRLLNELSIATSKLFDLNGDNNYVNLIESASNARNEETVLTNESIEDYIAKKEDEYNQRREAKGEEAKVNAMNTYDNQYRDKHVRQMDEYRRQELKAVDNRHKDKIVEIKNDRRDEAQRYFETGVAKILSNLGQHYVELRRQQKDYANEWGDKLLQFLDDNRAQDIARVEVMQQQLFNDDRFARMQSESDAEIQRLTQSFNSQVELIKANNETELERANNRIKALESEKAQISKERDALETRTSADYKELSARYNDVNQELATAKTKAALAELQQSQLNQRDREIEDWKNQVEIVSKSNDRNKVAFFCVSVLTVVAALLIGMIAGAQLF